MWPIGSPIIPSITSSIVLFPTQALINTTTLKSSIPLSSPISRAISIVLAYAGVVLLALPLSVRLCLGSGIRTHAAPRVGLNHTSNISSIAQIINRQFGKQYDMLNMGKEEMPEEPALTKEEMVPPASVGSSIDPHSNLLHRGISNVPTRPTAPLHPDAGAAHDK